MKHLLSSRVNGHRILILLLLMMIRVRVMVMVMVMVMMMVIVIMMIYWHGLPMFHGIICFCFCCGMI